MGKYWKRVGICAGAAVLIWCFGIIRDYEAVTSRLIRLHVVAQSDSAYDQQIKLQVRDAVLDCIGQAMADATDVGAARDYLQSNLPKIQNVANRVLEKAGYPHKAVVTLCREAFDTRYYDTFTLPAGVYEALRVTIGEGAGKNWWCVAFPTLCLPATGTEFEITAVGAGFSEELTQTLAQDEDYEVRFFLLDVFGKAEKALFPE